MSLERLHVSKIHVHRLAGSCFHSGWENPMDLDLVNPKNYERKIAWSVLAGEKAMKG